MDEKFALLTINLCTELEKITEKFLLNNLDEVENLNDVKGLILSSHISSLFNSLRECCQGDPESLSRVHTFMGGLMNNIINLDPIDSIEPIVSHNNNKTAQ
jgi:hypothetical protein